MNLPSRKLIVAWVVGFVMALACVGAGALIVVEAGLFPASASTPHYPIVAKFTHLAMIRSVRRDSANIPEPSRFTAAQVQAGARDYDRACSACHGAPGVARAAFADAMTPGAPYLVGAERWWRPRELYWIIAGGVKMTGMPAWGFTRSPSQLWDLVAYLEAAPTMTKADYARLLGTTPEQLPPKEGALRP
jgi:mono/diheme cytochrome c family protein